MNGCETAVLNALSFPAEMVRQDFQLLAQTLMRPSAVWRPTLTQDGNAWLAVYGDLPTGVVGCGASPALAMEDFDTAWFRNASKTAA